MISRLILNVDNAQVSYAKKRVIHGVSLKVMPEQIVALIGHNGAGKTTLLKAIVGLLKLDAGQVIFQGTDITNRAAHLNVREGIAYCPQGGPVFSSLTVTENLEVAASNQGAKGTSDRYQLETVFDLFPALYGRRDYKAGVLSGGERQMLAIGMSLMLSPKIFLIDEPSGGLAPRYVDRVFQSIRTISKEFNTPILLVEQNFKDAMDVAHAVCVMRNGRLVFQGEPDQARKVMGEKFFGFSNNDH